MEKFNEHSEKARQIMGYFEIFLVGTSVKHKVDFKEPYHDIARRFLNEIVEFEPAGEIRRSSLKPWATK